MRSCWLLDGSVSRASEASFNCKEPDALFLLPPPPFSRCRVHPRPRSNLPSGHRGHHVWFLLQWIHGPARACVSLLDIVTKPPTLASRYHARPSSLPIAPDATRRFRVVRWNWEIHSPLRGIDWFESIWHLANYKNYGEYGSNVTGMKCHSRHFGVIVEIYCWMTNPDNIESMQILTMTGVGPTQTILDLCKCWQRASNSPHKSGLWIVSHKGKIQYLVIYALSPSTWGW